MRHQHLSATCRTSPLVPLVALLFALTLLGCSGGGGHKTSQLLGFNDSAGPWSYTEQAQLHAPLRRVLVGWNQVQPNPASWDWSQTDAVYAALSRHQLRPLFVAIAAPCWAHPRIACRRSDARAFAPDPEFDGAWMQFLRRLAVRYPRTAGIEIWNEENVATQFLPWSSPVRYAALLKSAYRAIKSVNRFLPVISGGLLANPVTGGEVIADAEFLTGMYAAGTKGFMDGIGIHPYPVAGGSIGIQPHYDVSAMEQTLNRIRGVRALAGDAAAPLWVTETGVSTASYPGSPTPATPSEQGSALLRMVRTLENDRDVHVVIIHRLIDESPGSPQSRLPGHEPGYGVFWSTGKPKPAACALSAEWHGTLRC